MNKRPGKKTIYFVWNYTNWGGAQIYLMAIMKAARGDWNLTAIIPRDSATDLIAFLLDIPVEIEFLERALDTSEPAGIRGKIRRQYRRIRSEWEIFQNLRRKDLTQNILHIELAPWQSWILLAAFSLMRVNVFITLHNFISDGPIWRKLVWKVRLGIVSRLPGIHFFAANDDTREKMRQWISKSAWRETRLTYTGVDLVQIDKILNEDEHNVPAGREGFGIHDNFTVLCVGQFIDRKGRWIFLEAACKVVAEDESVRFFWVAPNRPDPEDMKIVDSYGLGYNFQIIRSGDLGASRQAVLGFFGNADVFVLPSFVEGLPIALLEAMALGIPSISTNVFAIPEAIKHMETGILIEAGDSQNLAAKILLLKNDRPLRTRLGQAGRNHVLANFDEWESAKTAIAAYRVSLGESA